MSVTDIDHRVTVRMARPINKDEAGETAAEIAEALGLTTAQVRGSLKRLKGHGEATEFGEAMSGGKTWTLTSDPRLPSTTS